MAAEVSLPVYVRVGDGDEERIGEIVCAVGEDPAAAAAEFWRAVADACERVGQDDVAEGGQ